MRLLTFNKNGVPTIGLRRGNEVIDLSIAAPHLPYTMPALLHVLDEVAPILSTKLPTDALLPLEAIDFLPPVPYPQKILCVGLNYRDHAAEGGKPVPDYPVFFSRFSHTLVGHNHALIRPKASDKFDYEGELAVIIGKKAHHLTKENALEAVAGYSIFHDGSIRDFQVRTPQWTLGKNFDATGGFGPEIVTRDELPEGAHGLSLVTKLNNEVLQNGNTADCVFDVATLLVTLTEVMTLVPGDVIITGTPAGVGFARNPRKFMKAGDVCEITIEGIGTLRNTVTDEK